MLGEFFAYRHGKAADREQERCRRSKHRPVTAQQVQQWRIVLFVILVCAALVVCAALASPAPQ